MPIGKVLMKPGAGVVLALGFGVAMGIWGGGPSRWYPQAIGVAAILTLGHAVADSHHYRDFQEMYEKLGVKPRLGVYLVLGFFLHCGLICIVAWVTFLVRGLPLWARLMSEAENLPTA